jgi:hypothetical protein
MSPLVRSCFALVIAGAVGGSPAVAQDRKDTKEDILEKPHDDPRDLTLLKRVTETTFIHQLAGITYTVPTGWKEIRPHRLERKIEQRISTVLGIERSDRDLVASLYWIPINPGQKLSNWINDTPDARGEYGEEYETLKVVYGKERVTLPVKSKLGAFEIYRININGGPDRGDRYDGSLVVFSVESLTTTWMMKARISFPKGEPAKNNQFVMDVLDGYNRVPEKPGEPVVPGK